jgi:hypothetical protein
MLSSNIGPFFHSQAPKSGASLSAALPRSDLKPRNARGGIPA